MQSASNVTATDAAPALSAPSRTRIFFLAGLLVFCFCCALFRVCDVDVGYHIRTGEHILSGNGIPAVNTFSYTVPNEPWYLQQWMPATIYTLAHRMGGLPALTIFKALLATLLMFLVYLNARDAAGKNSLWPLWVVTVAVLALRVRFFERPDLFTSALFALVLWLDWRHGNYRRWQWIFLPLLMALWANTHAGWVYGLVLLGTLNAVEWIEFAFPKLRGEPGEESRPPFKTLLVRPLSILLSLIAAVASVQVINPNGWKILTVPFTQFLSTFWQSVILEYRPPTWANSKLLFVWLAAVVVLQFITWRSLRLRFLLPSAVFAYFAFSSQRSLSAFIIASAPHVAFMLTKLPRIELPSTEKLSRALLPIAWAALLTFVVVPNRTYQFGVGLFHGFYPTEVFSVMRTNMAPQNVFNDMRFGGPMLWSLYPKFKPFIDGRGDAYTEEFWKREYLPVLRGDRWEEVFAKYQVTAALLANQGPTKIPALVPPLAHRLFAHPDWALVAYDDDTMLFLKRIEANQALIARGEFKELWPGDWNLGKITATNLQQVAGEATRAFDLYPGLYARATAARCAMVAGDYKGAADMLGEFIGKQEVSPAFWRDYAFCLVQAGDDAARTERVLKRMIRENTARGYAYYLQHFIALNKSDADSAKRLLAKAIEAEPENNDYRRALAQLQTNAAALNGGRSS
ncbi:MAG TPA: hypothetical protein VK530_00465 [Candidatus Acidoferrum sp.]|nr:hypothetical protein [Candidatus Acidoferrum sp.]